MFRRCARLAAALALLAAGACAQLPATVEAPPELALPPSEAGGLAEAARRVEAVLPPGHSAHWLLDRNELAYVARLALTDRAVASLDIQYFIWQEDATGYLLARRLLQAADRGVKVRLLLDDFDVVRESNIVVLLDAHPRIEVRVFNPWMRHAAVGKLFEFLFRWGTLNHRMHNKTYIADGRFAIVGGRNIGDRYFGLYERFVQNDLDVLVAGPVVQDVAASFDAYWNSELTHPVAALGRMPEEELDPAFTRESLDAAVAARAETLAAFPLEPASWDEYLGELPATLASGRAELLVDEPAVHLRPPLALYERFLELLAGAEREVLISSPYFVPDPAFMALMERLTARGVRVALVTNSLATNNHTVAHTGYRRWRRDALAAGMELYELRDDAEILQLYRTEPVRPGFVGLHSKAVVIDGRTTFIGSPNVDPRSMVHNTEIGIVTDSPLLAERLGDLIRRDMAPQNAWRVTMDEEGWLTWSGNPETLRRQPAMGFKQRLIEFVLNLLPLKKQV